VSLIEVESLFKRRKYDQVIERCRNILGDATDNPDIRAFLAHAYRKQGNGERAFYHFRKSAISYQAMNRHAESVEMLRAADGIQANEPDIIFRLAEALTAIDGPRSERIKVLLRLTQLAQGRGDRRRVFALRELHRMLPEDLSWSLELGAALASAGLTDELVQLWQELIPSLDRVEQDLSAHLQDAGKALRTNSRLAVELAGSLLLARLTREALALIVPIYEAFPEDISVLRRLVETLEAVQATEKIVPARTELLKARLRLGQRGEALRDAKELLNRAWDAPYALEIVAQAFAGLGKPEASVEVFRRAGELYEAAKDLDSRDRVLSMLLRVDPNDREGLQWAIQTLDIAGRGEDAAALQQRLDEVSTLDISAHSPLPSRPLLPPRIDSELSDPEYESMPIVERPLAAGELVLEPEAASATYDDDDLTEPGAAPIAD
jgi:tetratricopeptide (TPR) repeat protein